ncbi:hypothetical protein BGY98DRAFT_994615 [Russula aff. rugulosa BPL654]|nr:hypothetical protein BGY98DRAFT_994615 [Russula aff. rugulosa BPL654]
MWIWIRPASILRFLHLASFAVSAIKPRIYVHLQYVEYRKSTSSVTDCTHFRLVPSFGLDRFLPMAPHASL